MPNPWISALKLYNSKKGLWCLPKKGTKEHAEVMKIVAKLKSENPKSENEKMGKEDVDVGKRIQIKTDKKKVMEPITKQKEKKGRKQKEKKVLPTIYEVIEAYNKRKSYGRGQIIENFVDYKIQQNNITDNQKSEFIDKLDKKYIGIKRIYNQHQLERRKKQEKEANKIIDIVENLQVGDTIYDEDEKSWKVISINKNGTREIQKGKKIVDIEWNNGVWESLPEEDEEDFEPLMFEFMNR
jgi:hypothetical protein